MQIKTKRERLQMLIEQLKAAPPRATGEEALLLIETTLDAIEDAHSGVDKNPEHFNTRQTDGRMYPPHPWFKVASKYARCSCYRQAGHKTYILQNGAFRIVLLGAGDEIVLLDKVGADGEGISN